MTIRTSKADNNYFSISNNITNCNGQVAVPIPNPPIFTPDHPEQYDAILKICDGTSLIILDNVNISQGMENTIDLNAKACNIFINGEYGINGIQGDQVITVKGGCHDIKIKGTIFSSGKNAIVVCGNWSDQCFDKSYNLDFSQLERKDSQPVTFILARCSNVTLPTNAKVLRFKSFLLSMYWWGKWAYVKILELFKK